MKTKALVLGMVLLSLTACAGGGSSGGPAQTGIGAGGSGGGVESGSGEDTTYDVETQIPAGTPLFDLQASQVQNKNSIYGVWEGEDSYSDEGDVKFSGRMLIRSDSVTQSMRCTRKGQSIVVQLITRAKIAKGHIAVLESKKAEARSRDGLFSCSLSMDATEAQYSFVNGALFLTGTNGQRELAQMKKIRD